jgi:hypothetical protein
MHTGQVGHGFLVEHALHPGPMRVAQKPKLENAIF